MVKLLISTVLVNTTFLFTNLHILMEAVLLRSPGFKGLLPVFTERQVKKKKKNLPFSQFLDPMVLSDLISVSHRRAVAMATR